MLLFDWFWIAWYLGFHRVAEKLNLGNDVKRWVLSHLFIHCITVFYNIKLLHLDYFMHVLVLSIRLQLIIKPDCIPKIEKLVVDLGIFMKILLVHNNPHVIRYSFVIKIPFCLSAVLEKLWGCEWATYMEKNTRGNEWVLDNGELLLLSPLGFFL